MKRTILFFAFSVLSIFTYAQTTFWTETFGTGCNQSQSANNFNSGNGNWTVTSQGTNDPEGNQFYVSAMENGETAGSCAVAGPCGTNPTLHIGNVPASPSAGFFCPTGDCGGAYDSGGGCGFGLGCVSTNLRSESPIINCAGQTNISINFNYIEGGQNTLDDATLWYFDGTSWTQISTLAKTLANCGAGQGRWTAFSLLLPSSADNNPNVRIGFRWVNNDDGNGSDPSFAVDDVSLSVPTSAPIPVVTITPVGSTTICQNSSIVLNGSATNGPITAWQWSSNPSAGVTYSLSSTDQNVTVSFTTAGAYTFTLAATNANGTGTSTQTITVNAMNATSVTISSTPVTPVCEGSPIIFQATATGGGILPSYTWFENGAQVQTGNSPAYATTANNNDTLIVHMTPFGITCPLPAIAIDTLIIQTDAPVTPTVAITSDPATFCSNSNVTFTANATNGGTTPTFIWQLNGFPVSITNTYSSSSLQTGDTLIVNMLSNQTCVTTSTATDTFVVNMLPSPNLQVIQGSTTSCPGATDSLIVTAESGTTFQWSPAADLNNTTNDTVLATINTIGSYTYTIVATLGTCIDSASVVIQVTNNLSVAITGPNNVCNGSSVQLTANGGNTWDWLPTTGLSCTNCQSPVASPTIATTYTVNVTSGSCTASATHSITVHNEPSISVAPVSYCEGSSGQLNVTGISGATYTWTPSSSLTCNNCSNPIVSATSSQTYSVIAMDANGCDDTTSVLVTVDPLPALSVIQGNTTICPGGSDSLIISSDPGSTFNWSPSAGLSSTSNDTTLVSLSTLGTTPYTVTATLNGCPAQQTITVTVSNNFTVTVAPAVICEGDSVQLSVSGGNSWQWNPSIDLSCTSCQNPYASPVTTTPYTVTASQGSCTSTATTTVVVNASTTANYSFSQPAQGLPQTISFTNTSVNASTYLWNFGDNSSTSTTQSPSHIFTTEGTYTVTLIAYSPTGCDNDTITFLVSVFDGSSIVVPNIFSPNGDQINETFDIKTKGISELTCTIYDRWGLKISDLSGANSKWDGRTTSGNDVSEGTYFYVLVATGVDKKTYDLRGSILLVK